jgi:hypothetical protein
MLVSVDQTCGWCGQPSTVVVEEADLMLWRSGALIQHAFPDLSVDDRETLLSGFHSECFDEMSDPDQWEDDSEYEDAYDDVPVQASFGGMARAEALVAGYEDWMNVTVWPVDGLEPSDLGKDTTKGLQGSQNGTEA